MSVVGVRHIVCGRSQAYVCGRIVCGRSQAYVCGRSQAYIVCGRSQAYSMWEESSIYLW